MEDTFLKACFFLHLGSYDTSAYKPEFVGFQGLI